jgi:hypothetical protein
MVSNTNRITSKAARVIIRAVAIWESASAGCVEAEIELIFCNTEPHLPVLVEAVVYICEYNDLYGSLESGCCALKLFYMGEQ